ncbi:MAG TPA: type II toxin-antitoxin system VapC family toxin [Rhizomicrobium sp.]|jgi:PIN domain nuclease of toxin-antitoxin system|nr:type II toxin-antitoxin system VapC family toxin [Rhizomicrobium sp.]
MRPILLDTCAILWLVADAPMAESAMKAIGAAARTDIPLQISPITAWEVGLMARKGRFRSSLSPQRWFERLRGLPGTQLCELSPEVLLASSFLPGELHGDPADRIMAATAREYSFTLMTRDRALLDYAGEGHLAAIAC